MQPKTYQFADLNGAHLHYDVQGAGPALVMIHSALGDLSTWDAQAAAFAGEYRVIRYDVRGFGQSTGPAGNYSEYTDLLALLDHLKVERAVLMGCSYGGGVAIDFTLACPARVAALIPVGPALGGFDPPADPLVEPLRAAIHQAYEVGDIPTATELTAQLWVDGPHRTASQPDPAFRRQALALITYTYHLPDRAAEPLALEPPAADRLGEIAVPTLVILGEEDLASMHAVTALIEQRVPGAKRVILKDTAHLPNMERPGEFNQIVADFLDTISTG
jgi:3-oxoadipate enol-lactonase